MRSTVGLRCAAPSRPTVPTPMTTALPTGASTFIILTMFSPGSSGSVSCRVVPEGRNGLVSDQSGESGSLVGGNRAGGRDFHYREQRLEAFALGFADLAADGADASPHRVEEEQDANDLRKAGEHDQHAKGERSGGD